METELTTDDRKVRVKLAPASIVLRGSTSFVSIGEQAIRPHRSGDGARVESPAWT